MKIITLTLIIIIGMTACSRIHSDKTKDSNDSILTTKTQAIKVNKESLLLGIWWDANEKNVTCASFQIKDSTIYYPDQEEESEYKYQVKQDSLIIDMAGYISTSKIEKVTKDTLVLITDGDKQTFIKTE